MKKIIVLMLLIYISLASNAQTIIPLSVDNIININNKPGDANYNTALLDEQGADPINGKIVPIPKTAFVSGYATKSGYPAMVAIDLKKSYDLTNIGMYSAYGVDSINFEFSPDGVVYGDKITYHPTGIGFFSFKINEEARYIKVYNSNIGYQKVMETYFYGTPVPIVTGSGEAKPPTVLKTYTIEFMSDSSFHVVEPN